MTTLEADKKFLQAGAEEMEDYLLSNQLFWPLGGQDLTSAGSSLRLTLGGWLLAYQRVSAQAGRSNLQAELTDLDLKVAPVRTRWRAAWERKASWEFQSRLRQWGNYLEEVRQRPEAHADFYPQEVRLRVMLHLLQPELDDPAKDDLRLLGALDEILKVIITPGEFIWDPALRSAFPHDPFWYLYGHLSA